MALYNEILVGRFNRLAQKLLSMKGPAALVQLRGELGLNIPLMHGVENRYLEAWDRFGFAGGSAGVAAQSGCVRLRNPGASNVVAVVEYSNAFSQTVAASFFNLQLAATNVDFAGPTTGFRLDARGRTNSTCQVSTSGTGTSLVNNISQIANQASNSQPFILDENQEITLLPGDALQIFNVTVNQDTRGAFIWRERFLEDSERA